ncbi:hypothetical protein BVRB_016140 [Beta vulgaris subsp. vulgaris]|uniref:Uncharacterized protein n=1 Tax=Beta vulgaris subsp. vulgaris TaxID=3555 RepID=A0A0J8B137_BETVV|nr:hypothetical protein BVRB_016140 [Beta vulgaris subsp. vulgaris]
MTPSTDRDFDDRDDDLVEPDFGDEFDDLVFFRLGFLGLVGKHPQIFH